MKKCFYFVLSVLFALACAPKQDGDNATGDKDTLAATKKQAAETKTDKAEPEADKAPAADATQQPTMASLQLDTICNGNYTWSKECLDRVESHIIKAHPDRAHREGKTLHLSIENSDDLSFTTNRSQSPSDFVSYHLTNYYPAINAFEVNVGYYEGGTNKIINRKSGNTVELNGDIVASPDKKRFVVYNKDLATTYTFNGFHVFQVNGNTYEQEYKEGPDWGPENARWISNTKIAFEKSGFMDESLGEAVYALKGGNWVAQ